MRIFSIAWGGVSKQRLYALCQEQSECIQRQKAHIDFLELTHTRNVRDLIHNFQAALDAPDEDVLRDGLEAALVDLNDHVARLEEHAES
jgi:hypothetical protein